MKYRKTAEEIANGGSKEARRSAAVILETLAGVISPGEAAKSLGISGAKYYVLETRAVEGIVKACEPRRKGYAKTPARELEKLKKTCARLERECMRYQALARAAQKSIGIPVNSGGKGKSKGKIRRKPVVRALRLSEALKEKGGSYGKAAEGTETGPKPGGIQRGKVEAGSDS